jgi:hypothetical protein
VQVDRAYAAEIIRNFSGPEVFIADKATGLVLGLGKAAVSESSVPMVQSLRSVQTVTPRSRSALHAMKLNRNHIDVNRKKCFDLRGSYSDIVGSEGTLNH